MDVLPSLMKRNIILNVLKTTGFLQKSEQEIFQPEKFVGSF